MVNPNDSVLETLREHRIIAIARGIEAESADELAQSLYEGGIRLVEVTLNTSNALQIIARWRERFAGQMRIGAGTVLDATMAREAIDAGAEFLVSPNVDEATIVHARDNNVETFPGALTPTEIVRAWNCGATAIKVFPAATFGPQYLKELRGPLPQIPLLAVGGINVENLRDYLNAGAIGVGMGGNLVNLEMAKAARFDEIRALAARCVRAARGDKSGESA